MIERFEYLNAAWQTNPFSSDTARANSSYAAYDGGEVVRLLETARPSAFQRIGHAAFRGFVADDAFSCLGARAALKGGSYRFGAYRSLDDAACTEGLARDLYAFVAERRGFESLFTTFVAIFAGYEVGEDSEASFEAALWNQLKRLSMLDRRHHAWDPRVSMDPQSPDFSYSFAQTGFFVVGLHPGSSRSARRFAWPTLVFNAHEQFETLRRNGTFERLQGLIRKREMRLDGSLNANLSEYGAHSEARQYAGRPVPDDWECPFRPN